MILKCLLFFQIDSSHWTNGREVRGGLRLTGWSSIYRHFGLFADSLVKTGLSVMFSAREIAKRDAEKDELMTALSRSCEELTSL